jgi:glycosyltransferase involved in cell wall biosynthesis
MAADTVVIVTTYNEEPRIGETLGALAESFPGAHVIVADDGSADRSADIAEEAGVEVIRNPRTMGKGGIATLAAERVAPRAAEADPPMVILCDGDLADSARHLPALADAVRAGECDLAIAIFQRKVGGGFGFAVNFSRWATRKLGGVELAAPISGQRAMRADTMAALLPFAPRFGMETAMNIDAARAGFRISQIELPLVHRATGKTLRGFIHRARQLKDFGGVYLSRRFGRR